MERLGFAIHFMTIRFVNVPDPVLPGLVFSHICGETGGRYSGLDLLPSSGDLILRRHDGRELLEPGFEFENYDQHAGDGTGPESVHAFVDACLGREFYNGASGLIGLRTAQAIDAMYRSVKAGAPVMID